MATRPGRTKSAAGPVKGSTARTVAASRERNRRRAANANRQRARAGGGGSGP